MTGVISVSEIRGKLARAVGDECTVTIPGDFSAALIAELCERLESPQWTVHTFSEYRGGWELTFFTREREARYQNFIYGIQMDEERAASRGSIVRAFTLFVLFSLSTIFIVAAN